MKYFVVFCIVALAAVVVASEDEFRTEYCKDVPKDGCVEYKCNKDGSQISGLGCAESQCPGKTLEIKEDKNLPYPQCCPRLICE